MDTIPQDTPLKQCKGPCKQFRPITSEFFSRNKQNLDGFDNRCKECERKRRKNIYENGGREQQKTYYEIHRDERREYNKRYRMEHHEEEIERNRQYYQENRERLIGNMRRYYRDNRDRMIMLERHRYREHREHYVAYSRQYRKEHPEQCKDRSRRYYYSHREHLVAWQRAYGKTERGKMAARTGSRNRRSHKNGVFGHHTAQQIINQIKRQKGKCYYCNTKFGKGKFAYHVDHTFPLSRVAGTDTPANDISYLVIACPICNRRKGNKFPWEWPEGGRLF